MKLLSHTRRFSRKLGKKSLNSFCDLSAAVSDYLPSEEHTSPVLKTVGWVSAGVGALAIGVVVGRELRQRYKFKRRTPYDFYSHSGDERDIDFGLGI